MTFAAQDAVVLPGRAIGPVALLATRTAVDAAAGRGTPGPASGNVFTVRYGAAGLSVSFGPVPVDEGLSPARRVTRVVTASPRYRTASGIGVGSSVASLRRAYPAARCAAASCTLALTAAHRLTLFAVARGRVASVAVAFGERPPPVPVRGAE